MTCQATGWFGHKCSGRMEWAHLFSRRFLSIRWDPDNFILLCNTCHRAFTERPPDWTEFIETKFPGRWDVLRTKLNTIVKTDVSRERWSRFYGLKE